MPARRYASPPVDPTYDAIEARLKADPTIRVPTLVLHGAADPCNSPATSDGKAHWFSGPYERHLLEGIGHFPQREAPEETAAWCMSFLAQELQP